MKLSKIQRAELKQKFNGHCAYCGELLGDKWHADHIEAVKRELEYVGGGVLRTTSEMLRPHNDTLENLNPACVPCNTNKSSMSLESWRHMLGHYRDVQLLRDSTHARHLHRFGLIEIKPNPVVFFFETFGGACQ
ncbi:HNH endonuclease [Acinetobacter rudis]|uniref:HNH endonuclease n=1 Tax=Acinetobacter rudis TaxID=632955 RepID=UPI0028103148|nr:HNH endonuclease [Acinetobacter rudis]MDQ8951966.1 HNH endonuclease [Acinetobacter rudis]